MSLPRFDATSPNPGVTRRILAEAPELMVVSFRFEAGAEGKLHSHPHVQSTFVASGRFQFFRDGVTYELAAGDSLVIPGGVEHGCRCIESGELIDNFTPRRDDFLPAPSAS
ncbi:cupin domain-containing protein [Peteryoungia ipomoeae]|uniref:Cupin domain-containing protein n=1 Tax=Peteryoungia ipomoeae TaxID=1210932 RepID=A0A4S8P0H5_9HYPH|nr:cupin domain-containing protein [Peteryoungia ipomoeae]THV20949.1 cupin domain-containing protein [Peteryoungia ipomoeae]